MYQTAPQHSNTIRYGSAKVEIGADVASLVNFGMAEGIEFSEKYTPRILKPDNGPQIQYGTKEHTATVKFDLWEINLANLAIVRGGIDTVSSVAGSSTSVTDEPHVLTGIVAARLDHKNGAGTIVTSITVENAGGTAAVQNTDYTLFLDEEGYTCIARVSASTVLTSGGTANVSYTYVPYASTSLKTGGLDSVSPRVVRLTNTNPAGKIFRITVYAAENQGGIEIKLPADDDDKTWTTPVELQGRFDTTRTAGDQLFEIYDEQGVTA